MTYKHHENYYGKNHNSGALNSLVTIPFLLRNENKAILLAQTSPSKTFNDFLTR